MPQEPAVVSHTVRSDAPPTVQHTAPGPAYSTITNSELSYLYPEDPRLILFTWPGRPDEMVEALQSGWISSSQSAATVVSDLVFSR